MRPASVNVVVLPQKQNPVKRPTEYSFSVETSFPLFTKDLADRGEY